MSTSTRSVASIVRQVCAVAALIVGSLQDANAVPGRYGWILQAVGGAIFVVEHAFNGNETLPTVAVNPAIQSELNKLSVSLQTLVTRLSTQKGNTST